MITFRKKELLQVSELWTNKRSQTRRSLNVLDDCQQRFRKKPPLKQALFEMERKLFQTGSVKNTQKTGRS